MAAHTPFDPAVDAEVEQLAHRLEVLAESAHAMGQPLLRHLDSVSFYVRPATECLDADRLALAGYITRAAIEQTEWLLTELRELAAGLPTLDTTAREGGYQ